MARRRGALFLPLDTRFFEDARMLDAGEAAGWLYLAICCKAKSLETDGELTLAQVERLGIKGWQKRLDALVKVAAVTVSDGRVFVSAWLNHNDAGTEVRRRRDADAARKAAQGSERNPNGIGADSDGTPNVEVETEVETEVPPNPPETGGHKPTNPRALGTNPRGPKSPSAADLWLASKTGTEA